MTRLLLIVLLVLSSGPAYAEWLLLGGDDQAGMALYVEPGTISRNGDQVTMWILYDFKTVQTKEGGKSVLSAKLQREYDCKKERTRLLALTNYSDNMGSGEVVSNSTFDEQKWVPVTPLEPGTIAESLWGVACGKK